MLRSNWMLIKNGNQLKLNRLFSLIKFIQIRNRLQLISKIQKTIWINKQKKYFKSVSYTRNNVNNFPILETIEEKNNDEISKELNIKDTYSKENIIEPLLLQTDNMEEDLKKDTNINTNKNTKIEKNVTSDRKVDKKMGFITKLALHLKEQNKQNYPYPLTIKYL